ncbi:MAG: hypothetical protein A2Z25_01995 [Planctomycetes bacterium RBG_16_55_9]|nr:MAG: hypothetical protein A2Z25_01995 [Planctomycetes bacterium RBG_16_55_9]
MTSDTGDTILNRQPLPAEIVLSPSWWHRHEGMVFDEDFFFHPIKRVEAERKMEQVLYDRWGRFGLGQDRDKKLPQVGAVHLASGFLLSEMLGCRVEYQAHRPPQVISAEREDLSLDFENAFQSEAFVRFQGLVDSLKGKFGFLVGDVNWSGVLNLALDLRGSGFFMDIFDRPDQARKFLLTIARIVEKFSIGIESQTGTSSISVNRTVRFFDRPVFLHSECSHTMISLEHYQEFLFPIDRYWSERYRPFGIHYCGKDPHRYAEVFAKLPHLDFLDVGWGGDVKKLRQALPNTFLNIRLSPVEIVNQSEEEIRQTVIRRIRDSGNPYLTGVCCINMDDQVSDGKITAILETIQELRRSLVLRPKRITEIGPKNSPRKGCSRKNQEGRSEKQISRGESLPTIDS